MKNPHLAQAACLSQTTNELAFKLCIEPDTIRKRYSQTGSYFGLRPEKMPNGRLLWPGDAFNMLTTQRVSRG